MNCKPFQIEKLDWQRKPPCGAFFITRLAFYQSSTKSTNQRHKTQSICLCKIDWICFINRPPFHAAQPRRLWGRGFESSPPPNLSRGLTAIAVRPRFVSALSHCKTGTCADSLAENVWLPEKAFSGVFALQKRRNPFLFSVFSLRVKVMAIITTVREPILVLFFSARTLLSRE